MLEYHDDTVEPRLHGGEDDTDERGDPTDDQHGDGQPHRRAAQDPEEPPQAVEADVHGESGHRRPDRSGCRWVPHRKPYLQRDDPDLGAETDDEECEACIVNRSGPEVGPRREHVTVGPTGEQQEPEEQCRTAHLAEPERQPAGSGLALVAPADPGQDVERDGEGFPRKEEGEGVSGDEHDADRPEQEQVSGSGSMATQPTVGSDPADEARRDDDAEPAGQGEEHPGERVEANRARSDPQRRTEIDHPCRSQHGTHTRRGHERAAKQPTHEGGDPDPAPFGADDEIEDRADAPDDHRDEKKRRRHAADPTAPRPIPARMPCNRLKGPGGDPGTQTSTGTIDSMPGPAA